MLVEDAEQGILFHIVPNYAPIYRYHSPCEVICPLLQSSKECHLPVLVCEMMTQNLEPLLISSSFLAEEILS